MHPTNPSEYIVQALLTFSGLDTSANRDISRHRKTKPPDKKRLSVPYAQGTQHYCITSRRQSNLGIKIISAPHLWSGGVDVVVLTGAIALRGSISCQERVGNLTGARR